MNFILSNSKKTTLIKLLRTAAIATILFISATIITTAQTQKGADIDGKAPFDRSGHSVSMPDANTIAIGAIGRSSTTSDTGYVRFFTWNSNASSWVQKGSDIYGEAAGDEFGTSVSMPDANTIAIGAILNDGNGADAGHVRVYAWINALSSWVQKGGDIDGEATDDHSGQSVSMPDANTVAIGAYRNDGNGSNAGHVRVYTWNSITYSWVQKGSDIDGEAPSDYSGYSVSMPDTNTVAIGAYLNDGNGSNAGHVRVYTWNTSSSSWVQKGTDIDAEASNNHFGVSVDMPNANTIAIGATSNAGSFVNAGHVRVYTWNISTLSWTQKGNDIDGEAANDFSGRSVSMPDANTIAIGANLNDGNSANTGHVRVYKWDNNTSSWFQKGIDIDGEALGDNSGGSVSMPDTNTLAIGAINNSGNGLASGHVRAYEFSNPLSLYFVNFSAQALDNTTAELNWITTGEKDCSHFEIERSSNGSSYEKIGLINAKGNSNQRNEYIFIDKYVATQNKAYYRLKQVDLNGNFTYSGIVEVSWSYINTTKIYPNPTSETLTIECKENINQIEVIDIVGKVVLQETSNKKQINTQNLPNGKYILKIYTDKGIAIQSFIKE